MTVDIILIILGAILMIAGIAGCIIPAVAGIPLSYLGILFLHFTSRVNYSVSFLVIWAFVVVIVQVLDYYVPIWGTKKFGGGKYGAWGSTIGIVAGLFFPPWGIILFPFVGAVIGELIHGKEFDVSLKAGFGAFIGFVAGTLMKIIVALILAFYFFKDAVSSFF